MTTIFDVAKLAGVSIKTVSRVMNREQNVRHDTREAVLQAVEKLSYRPHRGARMMRAQSSGVIGLITGAVSSTETAPVEAGLSAIQIVRGVHRVCRTSGYTLMIADPGESQEELLRLLETFRDHRVDGVIFAANYLQQVAMPAQLGMPLVLANCFDAYETPAVIPDDYQGQRLAVEYLIAQGHRKIGYVGLETELIAGRRRRDGYLSAMADAGLFTPPSWTAIGSRPHERMELFAPLEAALAAMLSAPDRPTAICFGNDIMALRARALLERRAIVVPDDISLMGYDNDTTICEAIRPRLTTVELPYLEIGKAAALSLLGLIGTTGDRQHRPPQVVPGRIVVRDSIRAVMP